MVHIQPGLPAPFFLHHTEEAPAVPFIKGSVVRDQVEGREAQLPAIFAEEAEQPAGDAPASVVRLHIDGADIGGKVPPQVEIVGDDARPCLLYTSPSTRD